MRYIIKDLSRDMQCARNMYSYKKSHTILLIPPVIIKNIKLVKRKKYSKCISTQRETALFP